MMQFSLISLIPGLIRNLQDCADPAFDSYAQNAEKPTSLKTSERRSCMTTRDSAQELSLLTCFQCSHIWVSLCKSSVKYASLPSQSV